MKMQGLKRYSVFFLVGGIGYSVIEILWRGYTHPTMFFAGGISFALFSLISSRFGYLPILFKAIIAACAVTAVELAFGIVFNLLLGMSVWDYSREPLNFLGQICLRFSVFWCALGFLLLPLADYINKRLGVQ